MQKHFEIFIFLCSVCVDAICHLPPLILRVPTEGHHPSPSRTHTLKPYIAKCSLFSDICHCLIYSSWHDVTWQLTWQVAVSWIKHSFLVEKAPSTFPGASVKGDGNVSWLQGRINLENFRKDGLKYWYTMGSLLCTCWSSFSRAKVWASLRISLLHLLNMRRCLH